MTPPRQNGTWFVRRRVEHQMQELRGQIPLHPTGSEQIPKQVTLIEGSYAVQSRDSVAEPQPRLGATHRRPNNGFQVVENGDSRTS